MKGAPNQAAAGLLAGQSSGGSVQQPAAEPITQMFEGTTATTVQVASPCATANVRLEHKHSATLCFVPVS
jgi:hypothetical protein